MISRNNSRNYNKDIMKKLQLCIALFFIAGTVNLFAGGKTIRNSSERPNCRKQYFAQAKENENFYIEKNRVISRNTTSTATSTTKTTPKPAKKSAK